MSNEDFDWNGQRKPRKARGGIQSRSGQGDFARNWWARRWLTAMERLLDSRRLARGRSYARAGQVLSLEEFPGGVTAKVQGSRPAPYRVTIKMTPLNNDQWNKVLNELSGRAIFAAQLLAGEMPAEIEDVFDAAGVSLFPDRLTDLRTDCPCPDYANPCKHVAAVHYILGDRFDEDPFLILRLRGRTQEQILAGLRSRRGVDAPVDRGTIIDVGDNVPTLEEELPTFWEMGRDLHGFSVQIRPPAIPLPLLKRLGEPEVRAPITLQGQLEEVYEAISQAALSLAYGDFGAPPTNGMEE